VERDEVEAIGHRLMQAMTDRDFATLEQIRDPDA
jgi:hypothetical protein